MKYIFVKNPSTVYAGIIYNIIDTNNTEYPGYPRKGAYIAMGKTLLYYLNNDETSILTVNPYGQNPTTEECKVIDINTDHIAAEAITEELTYRFYKVDIKDNVYIADLSFMSLLVIIENDILYSADLNGEKIEPQQPIDLSGMIVWYDEPIPEDNTYHISDAFKRLINKLGITSDNKMKLINAIEFCCTKIRDGEDPDDPHKEISDVMFVELDSSIYFIGIKTFNLIKNVYEGDFPHSLTFDCTIGGEEYHMEYKLNEDCTAFEDIDTGNYTPCLITKYKTLNIPVDSSIGIATDRSKCYSITIEDYTIYGVQAGNNAYEFDNLYRIENGVLINASTPE